MTDLRIIKTQKAIKQALIELLEEKAFDDISVQEILNLALINRATFYKHYASKDDLAAKLIAEFKQEYADFLQLRLAQNTLNEMVKNMANALYQKRRLVLALWKIQTKRHHLYQDMHAMIALHFTQKALERHPNRHDWDYQAHLFATLVLTTARYHFERGQAIPLPQVFEDWQQMIDVVRLV